MGFNSGFKGLMAVIFAVNLKFLTTKIKKKRR